MQMPSGEQAYSALGPFARVVNIRALWRLSGLPPLPDTFCHVGLLGWHCHTNTAEPWDRASLVPAEQTPPMPANVTCIVCPPGWDGAHTSLWDLLVDLPAVRSGSKLPSGFYDMAALTAGIPGQQSESKQ